MTKPITHSRGRRLGEAVTLYTLATDRFKSARLTLTLLFPATEADAMPNTLLFGVLRRGSTDYPDLSAINRRLDELYGTALTVRNYLHGDCQVLSLTAEFLENRFLEPADRGQMDLLTRVMEVMAQILLHPLTDSDGSIRARAVEQEKISLSDVLRAERNDPRAYAVNRLRRLMCAGQPYGIHIGGEVPSVMALPPEAVTARFEDWMRRMNCLVHYVGRATEDEVAAAWQHAFGSWHPAPRPCPPTLPHPWPTAPRAVEESLPIGQGRLCMGWAVGITACAAPTDGTPDEYAAMLVFNEWLGVMQDAGLFRYVREELGLCYECESGYDATKGILTVTCGIRSDRRAAAEIAIRRVMDDVREGRLTDGEVTAAVASLVSSYRQIPDAAASLEAYWLGGVLLGLDEPPEAMIARVQAVTVADVRRVAQRAVLDTVYFLRGTQSVPDGEITKEGGYYDA